MELEKNSAVKTKKRYFSQTSLLSSYSEKAEHMLIGDVVAGPNHSGFGQAYSTNVPELKLSEENLPYLISYSDADLDMYNKKRMGICCAKVDESKKETDGLERARDDTHFSCGGCDRCRQSYLSEDSQLEYLSAHEQDFDDENSSSEFSEPRETIKIETLSLIDPIHEVPGGGVTQEQNLTDLLEDGCSASEYIIDDQTCPEAAMPEHPHLLQDSLSLQDCSGMTYDHQEEQTEYHSVVCGSILESDSHGVCPNLFVYDSLEDGEVKDMALIDGTLPPQMAVTEEVSAKTGRYIHSISAKQNNPSLSLRERAPAVAMQVCKHAEDLDFCSCEESGTCTHGTTCTDCTAKDAETHIAISENLTSKKPFFGEKLADKSSHGNPNSLNSELEHCESLVNIACASAVNQVVDASSDFRACFTTSRSTCAQVCLSSRAINTEITMMNTSRLMGWCCETYADAACNTDCLYEASSTEEIQSQVTDTLEEPSDGNTAVAERSSQILEQQDSKTELSSSDLKISTDRLAHLEEQPMKNSASTDCQKVLERAIEAELQILNAHFQMCYQHCLKIYKLALEENTCFSHFFNRFNENSELDSALTLVLEELKKNYNSMKKKIKMGVPLSALSPLSVEVKFFQICSSYAPSKLFREDLCTDSVSGTRKSDSEAPELQERKISDTTDNPEVESLTDGGETSDSTSSKTLEEQPKNQDEKCGCVKNEEGNEDWFDAKENLTVANSSVIAEDTKKQQEQEDTVDLREAKSGNEYSFIHVDGLSSSVSEADLRSHFQKYQICDVVVSVEPNNCRCALLSFKDLSKAKLAVEEMNHKKVKGKGVSVKIVNTSSESKYAASEVLKSKLSHEIQPVEKSQNDQNNTLTSASNSVEAPVTASEKITSSKTSCSTHVPSETKCPDQKPSTEDPHLLELKQKDTGENFLFKSSSYSNKSYDVFILPDNLNLSSFTKLVEKLKGLHPQASRDTILAALLEVRKNNNGILSGLSINTIVARTSAILRKSSQQ
ncbi:PREDICTED: RNA-binding protein 44 [Nestor notabilis]|uniref:RNA-binding protein 44 n=1 Tax=Nestor notabilis TaxID=176057 RepID=UPI000523720F|nr:PREDICTED: RNA-binding protein 44 [Nestor notabilis]